MGYYSRTREEKNIVIWMSVIFIIGGVVGVYLLSRVGEINSSYPYIFFASGYITITFYFFIKLVKRSGWLLFELPLLDAVIIYIFIPLIFVFFGFWYLVKVVILLYASFIGVIPYYFWNVGKLIFNR